MEQKILILAHSATQLDWFICYEDPEELKRKLNSLPSTKYDFLLVLEENIMNDIINSFTSQKLKDLEVGKKKNLFETFFGINKN